MKVIKKDDKEKFISFLVKYGGDRASIETICIDRLKIMCDEIKASDYVNTIYDVSASCCNNEVKAKHNWKLNEIIEAYISCNMRGDFTRLEGLVNMYSTRWSYDDPFYHHNNWWVGQYP